MAEFNWEKIPLRLLLLPILIVGVAACKQEPETGAIRGEVLDALTSTPIAGAKIVISPAGKTEVTDISGTFVFNGLPTGTQSITATAPGYFSTEQIARIAKNQTTTIKIYIEDSGLPKVQLGELLFSEGFEAGAPKNMEAVSGDWKVVTENSSGRLVNSTIEPGLVLFGAPDWRDYCLEVKMSQIEGDNSGLGAAFLVQDPSSFYLVEYKPGDSAWVLWKVTPDTFEEIGRSEFAVEQGSKFLVRVYVVDNFATVYTSKDNGNFWVRQLEQVTHQEQGRVGLRSMGGVASFDDIKVYSIVKNSKDRHD